MKICSKSYQFSASVSSPVNFVLTGENVAPPDTESSDAR
uniref:Uncharacterized protein n=1 Tax=Arundo donax TaxID=35708 RepID=A0A0A9F7X5_ARUDO